MKATTRARAQARSNATAAERCDQHTAGIVQLTKLIAAHAQNVNERKDRNWGDVGTLADTFDRLMEIMVSHTVGPDEDESEARARILEQLATA